MTAIHPSILNADQAHLADELDRIADADGLHEALGAGGMIRVPNPHAPAVLSRFDEEINRRARAECTTTDVIIERALIHYLRSA